MHIERTEDQLIIDLTNREVFEIQRGNIVGTRGGLIGTDSKVEIQPLSTIQEDDSGKDIYSDNRLELALATPLHGSVLTNGDVIIRIPQIVLSDVRVSGREIPRDELNLPSEMEDYREMLPGRGVRINFGGSLQVVDLSQSL